MGSMSSRFRSTLLAATAASVVAFAVLVAVEQPGGHSQAPSRAGAGSLSATANSGFDGAALPGRVPAPGFTLSDQSGARVSLSRYRGRVVVLAFLDSACGATCVLIAQQIRGALDELRRPAAVLIVSADPRADTPAAVRSFLAQVSLSGRVRYLTGSASELRALRHAYGALRSGSEGALGAGAPAVFLIDGRGLERVLYPVEQLTPEGLVHDIERLRSEP
jgi:protein SCO1